MERERLGSPCAKLNRLTRSIISHSVGVAAGQLAAAALSMYSMVAETLRFESQQTEQFTDCMTVTTCLLQGHEKKGENV